MKQLLQNMKDGKTMVVDIPIPQVRQRTALVRTVNSLVSAGTERMVVEFAEKSLIGKARSRPDMVRQLIEKSRREGIFSTIQAAFNRLDQPLPLGYSSSGIIVEVGSNMEGFHPGMPVACAGGGYAVHAEYVVVPKNLLVPLPPNVDFESAAFTTLGAIALHGFRLATPQLGENVAVIGLGLLGLLALGIARAAGCAVFGTDINPDRVTLAQSLGAVAVHTSEAAAAGNAFTNGQGFDVVLICADTSSSEPIELAGQLARDRARVIVIGAVGLNVPRKIYYDKELQLKVSRSYGPGRYDPNYEEKGIDYPIGYVRWTENRNMAEFVNLLANGQLNIHPLITHRFPIEQAAEAYELITGKRKEPFLGILLTYPEVSSPGEKKQIRLALSQVEPAHPLKLGVLGAGNYATAVFIPNVQKVGMVEKVCIVSASGVSAFHAAQKFGFSSVSSSEDEILENEAINVVAVLTRHQHHARQVIMALTKGKHVYCEKPLAINQQQLDDILEILAQPQKSLLTVGFNRRFSPHAILIKEFLSNRTEPLFAHYRVNAGFLPAQHWLHDPQQGGGRIIGECCHFIDLLTYLTGQMPRQIHAQALPDVNRYHQDNVMLTLTYPDGSIGNIHYLANGDKSLPKERLEVFCGGSVAILNDFRSLELINKGRKRTSHHIFQQDKGHRAAWQAFLDAIRAGSQPPIPYEQIINTTLATFLALESLKTRQRLEIPPINLETMNG